MPIATTDVLIKERCSTTTIDGYASLKPSEAILVEEELLNYLRFLCFQQFSPRERNILSIALRQELEPFEFFSKVIRKEHLDALITRCSTVKSDIGKHVSRLQDSHCPSFSAELRKLDVAWKATYI